MWIIRTSNSSGLKIQFISISAWIDYDWFELNRNKSDLVGLILNQLPIERDTKRIKDWFRNRFRNNSDFLGLFQFKRSFQSEFIQIEFSIRIIPTLDLFEFSLRLNRNKSYLVGLILNQFASNKEGLKLIPNHSGNFQKNVLNLVRFKTVKI